jgi:hypothetical protein
VELGAAGGGATACLEGTVSGDGDCALVCSAVLCCCVVVLMSHWREG